MRCAKGSSVSSATSMGTTLGGGAATPGGGMTTLGVGTTLGWRSAKMGRGCLNRTSRCERAGSTCFAGVVGGAGAVAEGGTGDIVGGDVSQFGHDEGGRSARRVVPFDLI